MSTDRRNKFTTMPGEIESLGLSIPKRLKEIVDNVPRSPLDRETYLSNLVKTGTITTDDVEFLTDSGALQI